MRKGSPGSHPCMTTSADDRRIARENGPVHPDLAPVCTAVAEVAAGVADTGLDGPTPCPDYTVRELLGHLTGLALAFRDAATKRTGPTTGTAPGTALLYSAIVSPLGERHPLLPLAVPLAVCETAELLRPGVECKVKWPNDVHLDGRKLAGILIEARPQDGWAVLGIGLNLTIAADEFPEELRDRATSLFADAPSAGPRRA